MTAEQTLLAKRFAKFCLVGGSGVAVNTLCLYLLHDSLRLALLIASPLAVEVAIINNFLWNNFWTFRTRTIELPRLLKFNLISLGGLAITTGILLFLTHSAGLYYLVANLVGIGVATLWNFVLNNLWTWGSA